MHGMDQADIVEMFLQVRQPIGNPCAAVADLVVGILRGEQLRRASEEGEALARQEGSRAILTVEAGQHRLVFEQLELTGSTGHMQIDDAARFGSELRRQWR